jgi:hypothetical protein
MREGSRLRESKNYVNKTHHAEGLVDQKCSHFFSFLILDTQEHVDSENIKLKIGYGSSLYQLFSKCDLNS